MFGHLEHTVFARDLAGAIQRTPKDCENKHAGDTAIVLFARSSLYLCYFSSLLNALVCRKGNDADNLTILEFFYNIERTKSNTAHAKLPEKLRPVALLSVVKSSRNLAKQIIEKPRECLSRKI